MSMNNKEEKIMAFNPNELVLERVRSVEEYDPATGELTGRYTQIEDPSLTTSADGTDVVDAMGTPIATFYRNVQGTFSFSNSLFSLDLAASQFGTKKVIADAENKMKVPVSETIAIGANGVVELKYVPVGVAGSEIKFVKVINADNTFGETYTVGATEASAEDKTFALDAEGKKITMPEGVTGKVFVNYVREAEKAASVAKSSEATTEVKKLLVHVIFCDPCNTNLKRAGVIIMERAQIDPSSVDLTLTMEGKHAASYLLKREYCDEEGKLFEIIVTED
jgi:hypothetical protein